jgi:signal transduction histidine kinase
MFYKQNKKLVHWYLIGLAIGIVLVDGFISQPIARGVTLLLFVLIMLIQFVFLVNKDMMNQQLQFDLQKQEQQKSLVFAQRQYETLIMYLPYPMIFINQQGDIDLMNDSFKVLLHEVATPTPSIHSNNVPFMLKRVLNEIYLNEESVTTTLALNAVDYQCVSIPVFQSKRYQGSLVVLQDITKLLYQERIQKRFVADASFALKTPILEINNMIDALDKEGGLQPENCNGFINNIKDKTVQLEVTIKDLLYMSKLSNQTILLNKQPLDLVAIAQESKKPLKTQLQGKGIEVNIECTDKEPVLADSPSMMALFTNLFENAIAYSQSDRIDILIGGNAQEKIISFTDYGVGISQNNLEYIFDRFYRAEDTQNHHQSGSGLGLSIVKELVEAHKGSISVVSTPNENTTFTIVLPKLKKLQ